jgi:hypothetical protein
MNTDVWYYMDESENVVGPLSLREMHELATNGRIGPETKVLAESLEDWTAAHSLEEFLGIGLSGEPTVAGQAETLIRDNSQVHQHASQMVQTPDKTEEFTQSVPLDGEKPNTAHHPEKESAIDSIVADWLSEPSPRTKKKVSSARFIPSSSAVSVTGRCLSCNKVFTSPVAKQFCWECESERRLAVVSNEKALNAVNPERAQNPLNTTTEDKNPVCKKCPMCAEVVAFEARICRFCRFDFVHGHYPSPNKPFTEAEKSGIVVHDPKEGTTLVSAGYICGLLSLLIFPPALGLAGLVCGIMNLANGRIGHGIAQIIISLTCGILGAILGAASMS